MPSNTLFIDDRPDEAKAQLLGLEGRISVRHPEDVSSSDIARSSIVLVDYRLTDWVPRDNVAALARKPLNGLAVAALLREHVRASSKATPTVFCLHSAHLSELSPDLPPETRAHVIAERHNLEWVFAKLSPGKDSSTFAAQLSALSDALTILSEVLPADNGLLTWPQTLKLLNVPDAPWRWQAERAIEECHPPVYTCIGIGKAPSFLRWLLHRILPYPCFLSDALQLARRLRVTYKSLLKVLPDRSDFSSHLAQYEYSGVARGFWGKRWWSVGIDELVWKLTEGDVFDRGRLHSVLADLSGGGLVPLEHMEPVICLGEDLQPMPDFAEIGSAARIQPDDWPAYADQAWTTRDLAIKSAKLGMLVLQQDRPQLEASQSRRCG